MEDNPETVAIPAGFHLFWKVRDNASFYHGWIGKALEMKKYPTLFPEDAEPEYGYFLQLGFKNGMKLQFEPKIELAPVPEIEFINEPIRPKK